MATQGGIPGIAVALVGAGALLVYAGLRNTDPISALRDIARGEPAGVANVSAREPLYTGLAAPSTGSSGGGVAQASYGTSGGTHPEIAQAAFAYKGDLYSQLKRNQPGYSDCSSFTTKAMRKAGIDAPAYYITTNLLVWRELQTIPRSQIGAGDILVSSGHVAIALSPTTAIGQQNSRQNVRVDTIDKIMWGQSGWVARRYIGSGGTPKVAAT